MHGQPHISLTILWLSAFVNFCPKSFTFWNKQTNILADRKVIWRTGGLRIKKTKLLSSPPCLRCRHRSLLLKMEPTDCLGNVLRNFQNCLRNRSEECSSQFNRYIFLKKRSTNLYVRKTNKMHTLSTVNPTKYTDVSNLFYFGMNV